MPALRPVQSYVRRRPELDPLHQVLSGHLMTFLDQAEHQGSGLPNFVKKELLAYLDCGLLCKGAIRAHCPDCNHSIVVALSCKGRGICPSCGGRRMNDTAAHLVDRVLPDVTVRQWVLSLPHRYRFLIARDSALLQRVVGLFMAVVFSLLRSMAKELGIPDGKPGSLVALQRFGDGLVFNTHMHALVLQGVYHQPNKDQPPVFVALPPPTQEQVAQVAQGVNKKVERLLRKRGLLESADADACAQQEQSLWDKLCAASIQGRVATGPKQGWRVRRVGGQPVLLPPSDNYLCADADGFNVHAHTSVGAGHKEARERLCRYVLRPALCGQRLSLLPSGEVIFTLKRTWSDGTQFLIFTPMELIEKLAVLVPPPGRHLVTYHGVLSSAAQWRKLIVPDGQQEAAKVDPDAPVLPEPEPDTPVVRARRLAWAALLQRSFGVDVLKCEKCGGRMKILALVLDPYEVARLCDHLGEPTQAPPVAPSRLVVQTQWDFPDGARPEQPAASAGDQTAAPPWDEFVDPPVPPSWDDLAEPPPLWDDFAEPPAPP